MAALLLNCEWAWGYTDPCYFYVATGGGEKYADGTYPIEGEICALYWVSSDAPEDTTTIEVGIDGIPTNTNLYRLVQAYANVVRCYNQSGICTNAYLKDSFGQIGAATAGELSDGGYFALALCDTRNYDGKGGVTAGKIYHDSQGWPVISNVNAIASFYYVAGLGDLPSKPSEVEDLKGVEPFSWWPDPTGPHSFTNAANRSDYLYTAFEYDEEKDVYLPAVALTPSQLPGEVGNCRISEAAIDGDGFTLKVTNTCAGVQYVLAATNSLVDLQAKTDWRLSELDLEAAPPAAGKPGGEIEWTLPVDAAGGDAKFFKVIRKPIQ